MLKLPDLKRNPYLRVFSPLHVRPKLLIIHLKKQHGAAMLLMALILITMNTLIVVFAANFGRLQNKIASNQNRSNQAYTAAQAGLDYGIAYYLTNKATVIASPSNGFINYSLASTTLANSSNYTVTYTNPVASNYSVILITSTGRSNDNTSTHVIAQKIASITSGTNLNYALTTVGNITTSGNINITGPNGAHAGGTVTSSGNSHISTIAQNDSSLASQSADALFTSIFGTNRAGMKAASTVYANSSGVSWGTLNGKIWIDSSVAISGNTTIGTTSNPVLLFVNGSFTASGNTTINGIVVTIGSTTTSGNFSINGAMVATGAMTMSGNSGVYNSTIVQTLAPGTAVTATVPGSWKDF